jgi:hypothetical protein
VILTRKLERHIFPEGLRLTPQVYSHIQNLSAHHSDKLPLGIGWLLEMEASDHSITRTRLVILYKRMLQSYLFGITLKMITLEKIAAIVTENLWFDDNNSLYFSL